VDLYWLRRKKVRPDVGMGRRSDLKVPTARRCAQSRIPIDMIRQGISISRFQYKQQCPTMSLSSVNTRLDNKFLRINCQMFQTAVLEREARIFADIAAMRGVVDRNVIQPAET